MRGEGSMHGSGVGVAEVNGAGEEGLGEVLGERGGYGSGCLNKR